MADAQNRIQILKTLRHLARRDINNLPGPNNRVVSYTANGYPIIRQDIQDWINAVPAENGRLVSAYIAMITRHIETNRPNYPNHIPDVLGLPTSFYTELADVGGPYIASQFIIDKDFTPAQFLQIQYVLVPMHFPAGINLAHTNLIVISPVDRTVELLDAFTIRPTTVEKIFIRIFHFLEVFLGNLFVPGEWRTMDNQAPQDPAGLSGCAVYTCMFAMSIACRENLNPNSYQTLGMTRERRKIAAELMNGSLNWPFSTVHPIAAHPGPVNRALQAPWQPLNQSLLTAASRGRYAWSKVALARFCQRPDAILGFERRRALRRHTVWANSQHTAAQFVDEIHQRLIDIQDGNYIP